MWVNLTVAQYLRISWNITWTVETISISHWHIRVLHLFLILFWYIYIYIFEYKKIYPWCSSFKHILYTLHYSNLSQADTFTLLLADWLKWPLDNVTHTPIQIYIYICLTMLLTTKCDDAVLYYSSSVLYIYILTWSHIQQHKKKYYEHISRDLFH